MAITIENTGRLGHVSPQRVVDRGATRLRIGTFGIGRREVEAYVDGKVKVFDWVGNDGIGVADVHLINDGGENRHTRNFLEVESPCLVDKAINCLSLGF